MKTNYKKLILTTLSAVIVLLSALMLGACTDAEKSTVTLLFKNGETVQTYTAEIEDFEDGATLYDLFVSEKYKDVIKADMEGSDYGFFLNGIYGMTADAANSQFIAIYSTLSDYALEGMESIILSHTIFYTANVGISDLPLIENAKYIFSVESWA